MDWIQQWQSKLNKQNGVAPLVRTGGSRHTGLAALPHRNIQTRYQEVCNTNFYDIFCNTKCQFLNGLEFNFPIHLQFCECVWWF